MIVTQATNAQQESAARFYRHPLAKGAVTATKVLDKLAPALATRLGSRMLLTPLPAKTRSRKKPVPPGWQLTRVPFGRQYLATWTHRDAQHNAPQVLLVHGWAGSMRHVATLGEAIMTAGFSPVIMEQIAHGNAAGWSTNALQWSRALRTLPSRSQQNWHGVVAHSLGALAAAHALGKGLGAERAVLISMSPSPREFMRWTLPAVGLTEGWADRVESYVKHREGESFAAFEIPHLVSGVAVPCLAIHDPSDQTAPIVTSQQLTQSLPEATLVEVTGSGHRRILESPQTIAATTKFLNT
jgi:pimeloyl-ACP methyl ester carboxylesterase